MCPADLTAPRHVTGVFGMIRKVRVRLVFCGSASLCQQVLHQSGCSHCSVPRLRAVGSCGPWMLCSVLHRPRGAGLVPPSAPCRTGQPRTHRRSQTDRHSAHSSTGSCQRGLRLQGWAAVSRGDRNPASQTLPTHSLPAAGNALGNCFRICPGSGCDQQEGAAVSSMAKRRAPCHTWAG